VFKNSVCGSVEVVLSSQIGKSVPDFKLQWLGPCFFGSRSNNKMGHCCDVLKLKVCIFGGEVVWERSILLPLGRSRVGSKKWVDTLPERLIRNWGFLTGSLIRQDDEEEA